MCQATYIFFLTLFYVQPIRQSEEHKQEIKVSVQRCLQRVALSYPHSAAYLLWDNDAAEVIDASYDSSSFHIYYLRNFYWLTLLLSAEIFCLFGKDHYCRSLRNVRSRTKIRVFG